MICCINFLTFIQRGIWWHTLELGKNRAKRKALTLNLLSLKATQREEDTQGGRERGKERERGRQWDNILITDPWTFNRRQIAVINYPHSSYRSKETQWGFVFVALIYLSNECVRGMGWRDPFLLMPEKPGRSATLLLEGILPHPHWMDVLKPL